MKNPSAVKGLQSERWTGGQRKENIAKTEDSDQVVFRKKIDVTNVQGHIFC